MAKNKQSLGFKREQLIISQQQRNNNPIFKTVYKRIRNLNKKLSNIDSLMELDKATLKPEQIEKIAGRVDVENQIKKTEDFAQFYKSILDQNGATINDNKDDLVKIATLLVAGQYLSRTKNLVQNIDLSEAFSKSYKGIWNTVQNNSSIQVQIGQVAAILNTYLKSQNQYNSLRNYISENPKLESEEINTSTENKVENKKEEYKLQAKRQKKQQTKALSKQEPRQEYKKQNKTLEQTKLVQIQKQPEVKVQKINIQIKKDNIEKNVHKKMQIEVQKASNEQQRKPQPPKQVVQQSSQANLTQNPENLATPNNGSNIQEKPQQNHTQSQRREYNPNRGYNKNYRTYNNRDQQYTREDRQYNREYRNNNSGRPYNNNYQYRNNQFNNQKGTRNYKNQNRNYKEKNEEHHPKYQGQKRRKERKGSDTSLEPTPEKGQPTQKAKYVSKN